MEISEEDSWEPEACNSSDQLCQENRDRRDIDASEKQHADLKKCSARLHDCCGDAEITAEHSKGCETNSLSPFRKYPDFPSIESTPAPSLRIPAAKKRKQGIHGNQDPKKAREAQSQKWSPEGRHQADSLVQLLKHLETTGVIKLSCNPSIQPHGIARIDVTDPSAFRSARLRWFQHADITGSVGESEPADRNRSLENSVNQAFRRSGLIPERIPRGYDWDNGRIWTFNGDIYLKYTAPTGVRRRAFSQADSEAGDGGAGPGGGPEGVAGGRGLHVIEGGRACLQAVMAEPVLLAAADGGLSHERRRPARLAAPRPSPPPAP